MYFLHIFNDVMCKKKTKIAFDVIEKYQPVNDDFNFGNFVYKMN